MESSIIFIFWKDSYVKVKKPDIFYVLKLCYLNIENCWKFNRAMISEKKSGSLRRKLAPFGVEQTVIGKKFRLGPFHTEGVHVSGEIILKWTN